MKNLHIQKAMICLVALLTTSLLGSCTQPSAVQNLFEPETEALDSPFTLHGFPDEEAMRIILDEQLAGDLDNAEQWSPISPNTEDVFEAEPPLIPPDKLALLNEAQTEGFAMAPTSYTIHDYAREVRAELGPLPVDHFNVLDGEILPITADGAVPASYSINTKADRPPLLPLGLYDQFGQSVPYSRIGRFDGVDPNTGNPDLDVMWAFIARRYRIRSDPNDPLFEDVAIIGYNARTGATAFFQMLKDNYAAIDATCVPSPMAKSENLPPGCPTVEEFWLPPSVTASIKCNECHSADPFIHTPYVDQVTFTDNLGLESVIVPSVPGRNMPYWFVGTEAFTNWPQPKQFRAVGLDQNGQEVDNRCIKCHRIGYGDKGNYLVRWAAGEVPPAPWKISDSYSKYPNSHWMPPEASHRITINKWNTRYKSSIEKLKECFVNPTQTDCNLQPTPGR